MLSARATRWAGACLVAVAVVVGALGLALAGDLPGDARSLESYRHAPVCLTAPAGPPETCIRQVAAVVLRTRTSGSRSPTYDVLVQPSDGSDRRWARSVSRALYDALQPGDAVRVRLWEGRVAWVQAPVGVASATLQEPGRQLQNHALGAWMCLWVAVAAIAYSLLLRRRQRVLAEGPASTGTVTGRMLPTRGSRLAVGMVMAPLAGLSALLGDGAVSLVPWLVWAGVGAAAGRVWIAAADHWLTIEVDERGVAARWPGRPPCRADWSEVRVVRSRRYRQPVALQVAGRRVPLQPLRLFTAANEALIAAIVARTGARPSTALAITPPAGRR